MYLSLNRGVSLLHSKGNQFYAFNGEFFIMILFDNVYDSDKYNFSMSK